jgi:predicted transcriptional regulator
MDFQREKKMRKSKHNITLDPGDLVKLDKMCYVDDRTRSAFIRRLIRQEWERRQQAEGEQK